MARKKITGTVMAAMVVSTIAPLSIGIATAQETNDSQCSAVEIITAAGTGEGNANDDPNNHYGLGIGDDFTGRIVSDDRFNDKVSTWQVPYSSSVGVVGSLGETRSDTPLPYGASRLQGTDRTIDHLEEVAASCPDTKFMLVGFSQGATVAGDVTAAIGKGEVEGVTADDVLASYLLADPGRAKLTSTPATTSTGAQGLYTENGAVLVTLDQNTPTPSRVGMTGARSADFSVFGDKVMSFCHDDDVACSVDEGSILNEVGSQMNDWTENHPNHDAAGSGIGGVDLIQTIGLFHVASLLGSVFNGDVATVQNTLNEIAQSNAALTQQQSAAMRGLGEELGMITSIIRDYNGVVPVYSGNNLETPDPIVNTVLMLVSGGDPKKVANLVPYLTNMMPHHLSYFQNSEYGPWTINGNTVDNWIQGDMDARLTTYLASSISDPTDIPVEPTEEPTTENDETPVTSDPVTDVETTSSPIEGPSTEQTTDVEPPSDLTSDTEEPLTSEVTDTTDPSEEPTSDPTTSDTDSSPTTGVTSSDTPEPSTDTTSPDDDTPSTTTNEEEVTSDENTTTKTDEDNMEKPEKTTPRNEDSQSSSDNSVYDKKVGPSVKTGGNVESKGILSWFKNLLG